MLSKEQSLKLYETSFWEELSSVDLVNFQLFEERLCMPFEVFHEAVEKVLGRPVFIHEFGVAYDRIVVQFLNGRTAPSFEDRLNLLPNNIKESLVL